MKTLLPLSSSPGTVPRRLVGVILLAAVSLLLLGIARASDSEPVSVKYLLVNDWGDGFQGEIRIHNPTSKTLKDWRLSLTFDREIGQIWNARIVSRKGGHYVIAGKDYNARIAPGQTVTFGFIATPGKVSSGPSGMVVSDAAAESGGSGGSSAPDESSEPEAAPDAETGLVVSFKTDSSWSGGFVGTVTVSNKGKAAVDGWTVAFDLDGKVTDVWNASVCSKSGSRTWFSSMAYNGVIQPGESASFGFRADTATEGARPTRLAISPCGDPKAPEDAPDDAPDSPDAGGDSAGDPAPLPAGWLSTKGSTIVDHTDKVVLLRGVNWFGMETETFSPHGLWSRSLDSMLTQIKGLGYNCLRLPFCNEMFDSGKVVSGINDSLNPDLVGLAPLVLLDRVIEACGKHGLKVILDRHRPDSRGQSELWYAGVYTEKRWIDDWVMLARRYKANPTVIGFDLHNEPHGSATWGGGELATDWRLAAERCGNAVLAANPRLLIIVEGVERAGGSSYWWGGNLSMARTHPVRLTSPAQLVYSTHDYPTSVFKQAWFSDPTYPANLEPLWDKMWGYLVKEKIAPVLLGEFGTFYESTVDRTWFDTLASYIGTNGLSFTYWCWNPNSGDTGGLLKDDWRTVQEAKQKVLAPLLAR